MERKGNFLVEEPKNKIKRIIPLVRSNVNISEKKVVFSHNNNSPKFEDKPAKPEVDFDTSSSNTSTSVEESTSSLNIDSINEQYESSRVPPSKHLQEENIYSQFFLKRPSNNKKQPREEIYVTSLNRDRAKRSSLDPSFRRVHSETEIVDYTYLIPSSHMSRLNSEKERDRKEMENETGSGSDSDSSLVTSLNGSPTAQRTRSSSFEYKPFGSEDKDISPVNLMPPNSLTPRTKRPKKKKTTTSTKDRTGRKSQEGLNLTDELVKRKKDSKKLKPDMKTSKASLRTKSDSNTPPIPVPVPSQSVFSGNDDNVLKCSSSPLIHLNSGNTPEKTKFPKNVSIPIPTKHKPDNIKKSKIDSPTSKGRYNIKPRAPLNSKPFQSEKRKAHSFNFSTSKEDIEEEEEEIPSAFVATVDSPATVSKFRHKQNSTKRSAVRFAPPPQHKANLSSHKASPKPDRSPLSLKRHHALKTTTTIEKVTHSKLQRSLSWNKIAPPINIKRTLSLPTIGTHYKLVLRNDSESDEEDEEREEELEEIEEDSILDRGVVDWNQSFQTLLEHEDSSEKFNGLASLARDFRYVAETYGRIIISESFCAEEQRKIKPTDIGGYAGGRKYCCQGILFKFALDVQNKQKQWLYGNVNPDNEKAMKAAANERKGLMSLFHCQIPGLHFPLMALIHYMGFCLIAMAILPIQKEKTIVYGSSDGGRTCYAKETALNRAMLEVGKKLNLREHSVRGVSIVGPVDIEGHYSEIDGRFYLIDCSRVMPPESPTHKGSEIFYNLLRPSFVREYSRPLCSDGLTKWIEQDTNWEEMNKDIDEATYKLRQKVIPQFAFKLMEDPAFLQGTRKPAVLIDEVHKAGVNIRHLGYIRNNIPHFNYAYKKIHQLILTECVARAIKCELRNTLRKTMENQKITRTEPSHSAIFQYLSPVLYQQKIVPTHLVSSIDRILVDETKRVVSYQDIFSSSASPITILSDIDIPITQDSFFMEIKLLQGNGVLVGICVDQNFDIIHKSNYYFSCNDGVLHIPGTNYARQDCHKNDVIGVFFNRREKRILFTINKTLAGEYPISGRHLRAAVGFTYPSEISYNFGSSPFVFDIERKYCQGRSIPSPIYIPNQKAHKFWCVVVKKIVKKRFRGCLTPKEASHSYYLKNDIDMPMLIQRIQELSSIKLSDNVLLNSNSSFVLSRFDIESISSSVRDMGIIAFAEGVSILLDVEQNVIEGHDRQIKFLKLAEEKISSAIVSAGSIYSQQYYFWGTVFYELAKRSEGVEFFNYLALSLKTYEYITETQSKSQKEEDIYLAKILHKEGVVLSSVKQFERATLKFQKMLQLSGDPSLLIKHLKNLKNQVLNSSDLDSLLSEAQAIINAFPSVNAPASMNVAEISMKIWELLYDTEEGADTTDLLKKAKQLAIKHLEHVVSTGEKGVTLFKNKFQVLLNTAIDGNQFGVFLELCTMHNELRKIIEDRLILGSLMVTHSRGLFEDKLKTYQSLFSPEAFRALYTIIDNVNKVDFVQIGQGFNSNLCKQQHIMNVVMIGDENSGKLDIKEKIEKQRFDQIRKPSRRVLKAPVSYRHELFTIQTVIDDEACCINIFEHKGKEINRRDLFNISGIFLLYNVKDTQSFLAVREYYKNVLTLGANLPIVLVGNEVPSNGLSFPQMSQTVSYEDGKALSDELGIPFFEAQIHGRRMNQALWVLARAILKAKTGEAAQSENKLLSLLNKKTDEQLLKIWPQVQEITPRIASVTSLLLCAQFSLKIIEYLVDKKNFGFWDSDTNPYWQYAQQTTRMANFSDADEFSVKFTKIILNEFVCNPKTPTKVAMMLKFAVCLKEVAIKIRKSFLKHELCVKEVSPLLYETAKEFISTENSPEIDRVFAMEIESYPLLYPDVTSPPEKIKIAILTSNERTFDRLVSESTTPKTTTESFVVSVSCNKRMYGISLLNKLVSDKYLKTSSIDIAPLKEGVDGIICVIDSKDTPEIFRIMKEIITKSVISHNPALFIFSHLDREGKTEADSRDLSVEDSIIEDTVFLTLKSFQNLRNVPVCELSKTGDNSRLIFVRLVMSIIKKYSTENVKRKKTKVRSASKVRKFIGFKSKSMKGL